MKFIILCFFLSICSLNVVENKQYTYMAQSALEEIGNGSRAPHVSPSPDPRRLLKFEACIAISLARLHAFLANSSGIGSST